MQPAFDCTQGLVEAVRKLRAGKSIQIRQLDGVAALVFKFFKTRFEPL